MLASFPKLQIITQGKCRKVIAKGYTLHLQRGKFFPLDPQSYRLPNKRENHSFIFQLVGLID